MASRFLRFLVELKRRKVYHVGVVYLVVGFAVAQGAEYLFQLLEFPLAAAQFVAILIAIGFPIALVLAWAYEVRPEEKGSAASEPPLSPGPDRKSIAVLPFANRSGRAEDLHFTDGIHDQIISQLHKVGSLSVRGRTSVEVYRNSPKNLKTIGEELNAHFILEGGVQRAGDQIRIIVQLIQAETDEHLLAEEYDRSLTTEKLFEVQSEIALAVVRRLEAVLTPGEKTRIQARPTKSLKAYDAFLRGKQYMARQTGEGILRSMKEFETAIEADPGFAQAHSALANAYLRTVTLAEKLKPSESEENLQKAKLEAEKALELDPLDSEAHVVLAIRALQWEWDWETARVRLFRAMELNPSDPLALMYYAVYLCYRERRFTDAQRMARQARDLDPFDPFMTTYWIWILWAGGEHGRALEEARKAAEIWPERPFTHYWAGIGLLFTGHPEQAIRELETAMEVGGRMTFFLSLLGAAHGMVGQEEDAREYLKELEGRAEQGFSIGRWIASVYAALGEGDEAMKWLDQAVDHRDPAVFHAMTDPFFRDFREDPRFLRVMRRIGLKPDGPTPGGKKG